MEVSYVSRSCNNKAIAEEGTLLAINICLAKQESFESEGRALGQVWSQQGKPAQGA